MAVVHDGRGRWTYLAVIRLGLEVHGPSTSLLLLLLEEPALFLLYPIVLHLHPHVIGHGLRRALMSR